MEIYPQKLPAVAACNDNRKLRNEWLTKTAICITVLIK